MLSGVPLGWGHIKKTKMKNLSRINTPAYFASQLVTKKFYNIDVI